MSDLEMGIRSLSGFGTQKLSWRRWSTVAVSLAAITAVIALTGGHWMGSVLSNAPELQASDGAPNTSVYRSNREELAHIPKPRWWLTGQPLTMLDEEETKKAASCQKSKLKSLLGISQEHDASECARQFCLAVNPHIQRDGSIADFDLDKHPNEQDTCCADAVKAASSNELYSSSAAEESESSSSRRLLSSDKPPRHWSMKPAIPDKIAAKCPVLKLRRPTRLKDGELSDTEVDRCMQQFCKWKDSQKFVHNGYLPFSLWENDDSRFWKPVQEHGEGCCALTLAQKFPFDKEGSKHFSDMKHMPSHRHSDTKFGASVEEAGSKKAP
ncbi:MAG: hypothetical protein CMO45_11570 [Verrucomicrobiales bacterium]|nr:hypothetical protein [Verrucomicrobiales bacterium]